MNVKDLIRLPLGKHEFKDKYYTYKLEKYISDYTQEVFFRITTGSHFGQSLLLFLVDDDVYEKGYPESDKYFRKVVNFHMSLGGISVDGKNQYNPVRDWVIVPKSSYKEWLKKVENLTSRPIMNECVALAGEIA